MTEQPPRTPAESVTWSVRVAAAWTWRLLVIGAGMYILAKMFKRVELVAFSFVLALFLTAVLHPLERWLRRVVPGPRTLTTILTLLIGLAVLSGIGYFVAWQITTHAAQLGDQISAFFSQARDWLKNGPLHLKSQDLNDFVDKITNTIKDNQGRLISGAIATVRTLAEVLGSVLLILLSTVFLLRDGADIWAWTLRLFPRAAQPRIDAAGRVGWRTFGGYMRGQVLIALFHGLSVMIMLFILRVPLAAALGVLIFLGSFIPLLGLTVTGLFAVVVALLEHGATAAIVVGVAIVILIQLEAHFLQPIIMSRSVEVHPLAIALSVITGTILGGIPGAVLAVPLVAFLNSTIHALREWPAVPDDVDVEFPVAHRKSAGGSRSDPAAAAARPYSESTPADEPEPGGAAD